MIITYFSLFRHVFQHVRNHQIYDLYWKWTRIFVLLESLETIGKIVNRVYWKNYRMLTLKWPRYVYSHWCPRGFHGPPWENHFPTRILQWNLHHICTGHKKSQFCKKNWKCCTVSKWRPNNRFLFLFTSILATFWKTTFQREFLNEIWLNEGEYE